MTNTAGNEYVKTTIREITEGTETYIEASGNFAMKLVRSMPTSPTLAQIGSTQKIIIATLCELAIAYEITIVDTNPGIDDPSIYSGPLNTHIVFEMFNQAYKTIITGADYNAKKASKLIMRNAKKAFLAGQKASLARRSSNKTFH